MRLFDVPADERALYSWESFLRAAVYCTNIQGSALYDATLGDQDLIEQMYQDALAEQSSKIIRPKGPVTEFRPPRRGYSREVEALYDLQDNIIAMRAEAGHWPRTSTEKVMTKRPWFPAEVVQERMAQRSRTIRDNRIAAAQARHRQRVKGDVAE